MLYCVFVFCIITLLHIHYAYFETRNILLCIYIYILLTVHSNIMIVFFFYQLDAQILYFNAFTIFLYMFRALYTHLQEVKLY